MVKSLDLTSSNNPLRPLPRSLATICLMFFLMGCENDSDLSEKTLDPDFIAVQPVPDYLSKGLPDYRPPTMLTVGDQTAPEDWLLALHLQQHDQSERQPEYYRQRLQQIEPYVHDTPRVIANRTVQISRQLQEQGIQIAVDTLLTDFATFLPNRNSRQRYVYGDLCAQYVNLRRQGTSHHNAVRFLFRPQFELAR